MQKVRDKSYVHKVRHEQKVRYKKLDIKLISTSYVHNGRHKKFNKNLQLITETTA